MLAGSKKPAEGVNLECRECTALLDAWADGELDAVQQTELEMHLTACADCREVAERLRRSMPICNGRSSRGDRVLCRFKRCAGANSCGSRSHRGETRLAADASAATGQVKE